MGKWVWFAGMFMLLCLGAGAQKLVLAGRVLDAKTGETLIGAHIKLVSTDRKTEVATVSNEVGRYRFAAVYEGEYVVFCSFLGYETLEVNWVLGLDADKDSALVLRLRERSVKMDEVLVKAQTTSALLRGDTVQMNASSYKTSRDASAGELVDKMPGIVVENGSVEAHGEAVKRVLVDGKEFLGNNPNATLSAIPAEMIDKIEVYDEASEQAKFTGFDDGETSKTINIVTKKSKRIGVFGKLAGGVGPYGEYLASGGVHFFTPKRRFSVLGLSNNLDQQNFSKEDMQALRGGGGGFNFSSNGGINTIRSLGLNYTDEWSKSVRVEGSYFLNRSENRSETRVERTYFEAQQRTETETMGKASGNQHRLVWKMNWDISENTSVEVQPLVSVMRNTGTESTEKVSVLEQEQSMLSQRDAVKNWATDFEGEALVKHRFAKPQRTLSVEARLSGNNRRKEQTNTYSFRNVWEEVEPDLQDQSAEYVATNESWSANVNYTEPVAKNLISKLDYRFSKQTEDSDKGTYDNLSVGERERLVELSNVFIGKNMQHSLGLGLRYKLGKLRISARTNWQRSVLESVQSFPERFDFTKQFDNILWRMRVQYEPSKTLKWRFNYSTNTDNPNVGQLQELVDYSDPYLVQTGNVNLQTSLTHKLSLRFTWQDSARVKLVMANLAAKFTENDVTYSNTPFSESGVSSGGVFIPEGALLRRPVNVNGFYQLRAYIMFARPIAWLKSNLQLRLMVQQSHQPTIYNGVEGYRTGENGSFIFGLNSNISEYIDYSFSSSTMLTSSYASNASSASTRYFNQSTRLAVKLSSPSGWFVQSKWMHRYNEALASNFTVSSLLWSASIGAKVFKSKLGEIKLAVNDILGENKGVRQSTSELYLENSVSEVLERFVLLVFTYRIRGFGGEPPMGAKPRKHQLR